MSNNQWNSGQGDGQWQQQGASDWNAAPQPSAPEVNQDSTTGGTQDWNAAPSNQEWDASAQGQAASGDWNTGQPAQDWNAGAQPQPSATDWNAGAQPQTSATDWNAGAQPQPSAGDWNQQQQGWGAGAQAQQGWDPNQQAGGASAYGQQPQWQQQQQPPRASNGFANVFDFSFKKFALPDAAGTIFLIAVIAIAVKWIFDVVSAISYGGYGLGASSVLQAVIGGLAWSVLWVLVVRVLIEGMSSLVSRSKSDKD